MRKTISLAPFTFEQYPANAGGENKLYQALLAGVSMSMSTGGALQQSSGEQPK
jgi:hypothetical protein